MEELFSSARFKECWLAVIGVKGVLFAGRQVLRTGERASMTPWRWEVGADVRTNVCCVDVPEMNSILAILGPCYEILE